MLHKELANMHGVSLYASYWSGEGYNVQNISCTMEHYKGHQQQIMKMVHYGVIIMTEQDFPQ